MSFLVKRSLIAFFLLLSASASGLFFAVLFENGFSADRIPTKEPQKLLQDKYDQSHQTANNTVAYPEIRKYNYANFIKLVDETRKLAAEFRNNYNKFINSEQNRIKTADLLQKSKLELEKFSTYVNSIRTRSSRSISNKRKKSLSYYTNVMEDNIQELEDILQCFIFQ